jgi:hypothetical protein
MNWIPFGGAVPGPVDFGLIGGAAWVFIAVAAAVPAAIAANRWFEIGIRESLNALVDLNILNDADKRAA